MAYSLLRRQLAVLALFLLAPAVVFYVVDHLRTPVLHAGDRLERSECRHCGGSGRDESLTLDSSDSSESGERCGACRGDGEVRVIVPGPHHPTSISGIVRDEAEVPPLEDAEDLDEFFRERQVDASKPFKKPAGAIARAKLSFRQGGQVLEAEANPHGRFAIRLPPGLYDLAVHAAGFESLEEEIEIEPLSEPIWLEEAVVVREPDSLEEARSQHGLRLLVGMARSGEGESWMEVEVAGPLSPR